MKKIILAAFACMLILDMPFCELGARAAEKKSSPKDAVVGNSWVFGQSLGRNDAIWKQGVGAKDVQARATGKKAAAPKRAADTRRGVESALKESGHSNFPGGISMETQSSNWKVAPQENFMRPDESRPRAERHVVRAFADMAPSDDLDINIGPELILKDERKTHEMSNASQPDTMLGVGMNFKLDF